MAESKVEQEMQASWWQWLLFVIVIPSAFAASFLLLILNIAGVDAAKAAKQWTIKAPFVSEWINWSKREKALQKTIEAQQQTINRQKRTIADQQKQIKQLKNELAAKEKEIAQLSAPSGKTDAQAEPVDEPALTEEDVVGMYGAMSEKQAAAILAELPESEALRVLSQIDGDKAAAILEQMPAGQAAKLLASLSKRAMGKEAAE
ncbi:MotE family protein [Geobacillus sp. C56-T3]|uniref:MotE family protein n=1 Tax=Geobacillus sp. (strain C56-T3) TaxID=691437 RepID=UPI0001D583E0|nr:MgtE intracellular region [Geobacillus sp. C56-T3]ADI27299.1 MgtE intracellular region [Geobacillus sp. C56-T3]